MAIELVYRGAGSGAVKSVNGKTGEVVLTAEDVGAATEAYVDEKVSVVDSKFEDITKEYTTIIETTSEEIIDIESKMIVGAVYAQGKVVPTEADYQHTELIKLNATKQFEFIGVNKNGLFLHPQIRYLTAYDEKGNCIGDYSLQRIPEASAKDGRIITMDKAVDSVIITVYKAWEYTDKKIILPSISEEGKVERKVDTDKLSTYITKFDTNELRYGNYKGGIADFNVKNAICSTGFINPFVKSIEITDTDYMLAVCVYVNGIYKQTDAWYMAGETYHLDKDKQYKIYVCRTDEKKIMDGDNAKNSLKIEVAPNVLLNEFNKIQAVRDIETNNMKKQLEYMMRRNYDISYANAPSANKLTTYTGNNQIVHPKVLYFPNKFGGYKYWMAYTPFPWNDDIYENPCIAYSNDGYEWQNIAGNPLDNPMGVGYNSDTHLVYIEATKTLEVWYRYVGDYDTPPVAEVIYRQTSTDGIHWSAKEVVINNNSGDYVRYLSPAVNHDGEKYKIWVVNSTDKAIDYYEGADLATINKVKSIKLTFTHEADNYTLWHIDLIEEEGKYILLAMCKTGDKWSLFISTSTDNETYTAPYVVMLGNPYGWDKMIYRSSLVNVNGEYRIYYSALDENKKHGLGISTSQKLSEFVGVL